MQIDTDRLILRFLSQADVDDVLQYQGDPDTVRFIPWEVRSRDEVLHALEKAESFTSLDSESSSLLLAIVLRATNQVVGQLNTSFIDKKNSTANVGYVLNPNFRAKGYVNEALAALIDYLFARGDVHRIIADIDIRNESSVRVVERLGFRREATFIENDFLKGEWCSMYLYALLSREWRSN